MDAKRLHETQNHAHAVRVRGAKVRLGTGSPAALAAVEPEKPYPEEATPQQIHCAQVRYVQYLADVADCTTLPEAEWDECFDLAYQLYCAQFNLCFGIA